MYIHEYLLQRSKELELSLSLEDPVMVHSITQVLIFFGVHLEDEIEDQNLKIQVAEEIFSLTLSEMAGETVSSKKGSLRESILEKTERVSSFIPAEEISKSSLKKGELEWPSTSG